MTPKANRFHHVSPWDFTATGHCHRLDAVHGARRCGGKAAAVPGRLRSVDALRRGRPGDGVAGRQGGMTKGTIR
jgi:hypothetical protein